MNKPYVIAINSISGGGKTALTQHLANALPNAVRFHFDVFDDSNIYPADFHEWWQQGADLLHFDCPGMAEAVEQELNRNTSAFVVLDYPFGRDHPRFEKTIDLSVFIDTPLDIAMARRILRDFSISKADPKQTLDELKQDLTYYLAKARPVYLGHGVHRDSCDLVLDGAKRLDMQRDQILDEIFKFHNI